MGCPGTCVIAAWKVEELVTCTISEDGWEEVVERDGRFVVITHDPPGPITLSEAEVIRRVEGYLGLVYGMTEGSEGCAAGCRCLQTGKPKVVLRGTVRDRFDSVVMTPEARIRYTVTISFEVRVVKTRAPGECLPERLPFVPDPQPEQR